MVGEFRFYVYLYRKKKKTLILQKHDKRGISGMAIYDKCPSGLAKSSVFFFFFLYVHKIFR